ncbi:ABC transporter substrate-binding protein [Candidatus Woesearchaeota archaeon]|nr:ABC transporter substrate-binding protein [Candidatus Woesearchaeota archaeon]
MKKTYLVIALLLVLIGGCTQTPTAQVIAQDKVKVGALVSLTGQDAYFGNTIHKGLLLAAKNKDIELIIEDYGSETKNSVTAANKLVNIDKVDVLLTEYSESTEPVLQIIKEKQIPTICVACGSAGITQKSILLFRVWPSDEIEVKSLVNYAKQKEYDNVAVLKTISVWENSLTEYFEKNWGGEVFVEQAKREYNDFRTQLLKIKQQSPGFIYLAMYEQKYPQVIKQIRELGIKAEIATTTWINDPTILEACGKNCEEVIVPQYAPPTTEFVEAYKQEYKEEPGIGAEVAYDAINIIAELKDYRKTDFVKTLLNTEYAGASGEISFDYTGDRKDRKVNLYKIKNQELELIE